MLSRVEVHGASCPTMKSGTMIVGTLLLTVKKLMLKILIGRREEIKLSYKVFVFRGDSEMNGNTEDGTQRCWAFNPPQYVKETARNVEK